MFDRLCHPSHHNNHLTALKAIDTTIAVGKGLLIKLSNAILSVTVEDHHVGISSYVAPNHQISDAPVVETFPSERRLKSDVTKQIVYWPVGL